MGAVSATCPVCEKSWSGSRAEHCAACHETFVGTRAGDAHRVGDHALPRGVIGARRCLSPQEMHDVGMAPAWHPTAGRMWFVVADRERVAAAFGTNVREP